MQNQLFPLNVKIYYLLWDYIQKQSLLAATQRKKTKQNTQTKHTFLIKSTNHFSSCKHFAQSIIPVLPHTMGLQGNKTSRQQQYICEKVTGQTGRQRCGSSQSSEYPQTEAGSNPPTMEGTQPCCSLHQGTDTRNLSGVSSSLPATAFFGTSSSKTPHGTRATKPQHRAGSTLLPQGRANTGRTKR